MASLSNVTPKFDVNKAIKYIADYKTEWHKADKAGDTQAKEKYKNLAQRWYTELENNGYSDVATTLHNTNDVGAKAYYDSYIKNNTVTNPTGTTTGTPTNTKNDTTTIEGKINDLYGTQSTDRQVMAGKYDTLEDYNYNHNPYESDIGKSIMKNYQYQGKVESDNTVAENAGTNAGNIDSYASANANRQQLAFTNAGNQAILNDFNTRVNNARGILSDLGVYQQNQDKGMQTTINQHQTEEQRVFENDETSKNNQVDRDVKTSEVTGVVPKSMEYGNNPYFNADGTLVDPHNTDYSLIISNAREKLKTTTNPTDRANLEQTIRDATQARAYKILHVDGYSQWAPTMETVSPTPTFTSQATNKELDYNKDTADKQIESSERMNSEDNETTVKVTGMNNATDIYGYNTNLEGTIYATDGKNTNGEKTWEQTLKDYDLSDNAKELLNDYVYPVWGTETGVDILDLLSKSSTKISSYDASEIFRMLGVTDSYVSEYTEGKINSVADWKKQYTWKSW